MIKDSFLTITLNKFDVAERQLNQAIWLFFNDGDVVSIHTLSEASGQIFYDLKGKYNLQSIFRDSDLIREECKKEWFKMLFRARNFFKHASNDCDETIEFKEEFNNFSLFDAVNMYSKIKKIWTPESLLFYWWFILKYPNFLNDDGSKQTMLLLEVGRTSKLNKVLLGKALVYLRSGQINFPNVELYYGLKNDC